MLDRILSSSLQHRWVVLAVVLAVSLLGLLGFQRLPIDAVPDITNVQVQINTEAAGFSPLEVEQYVTNRVENAMGGLPELTEMRSVSKFGISSGVKVSSRPSSAMMPTMKSPGTATSYWPSLPAFSEASIASLLS